VLLTGAAGFIGSAVKSALEGRGHEVVAIDAFLPSAHGPQASADGVSQNDIRDSAALRRRLEGIDVVCHQAAVVGAGVDAADAPAFASHNDFGTAVLLSAMADAGCRRLVLASSMVVYGEGRYTDSNGADANPNSRTIADLDAGNFDARHPVTGEPLDWALVAEDAPLRPRSLYAASKLAQENYASAWARCVDGEVTALRYHNVYGARMPRDTPYSGVAAMFRSALEAGRAPEVFEDGAQMRDFVDVRDVALANALAVERPLGQFTPINVCSSTPVSILDVAKILAGAVGGPDPQVSGKYRPGDVRHVVADPAFARESLGFDAEIAPNVGLAEFAFAQLRVNSGVGRPCV
jgi:dTDP-L-rhamnose 4-epimerase